MRTQGIASIAGRLALASGFLSAIADRFGLWGPPGSHYATWGDWPHFVANVAALNWFMPAPLIPFLAWLSTFTEATLGVLLLLGYKLRCTAYASAVLLLLFAGAMTMAYGIKAPLDYSVFAASTAALLLGASARQDPPMDALTSPPGKS
jgi:uncharacterized membrane protein YphA (DoxX/SURF4 family)